jgi:hypothetical protein
LQELCFCRPRSEFRRSEARERFRAIAGALSGAPQDDLPATALTLGRPQPCRSR